MSLTIIIITAAPCQCACTCKRPGAQTGGVRVCGCPCVMRLLAFRQARELRTIGEMRAFIKRHELAVDGSADARKRGVKASIKAQILTALQAKWPA